MKIIVAFYCFAIALIQPSLCDAATIQPDMGIHYFGFGIVGSSLGELTFTLTKPADLVITDIYASGDQFNITNNNSELGKTSLPTAGFNVGDNYFAALSNPAFSKASFLLLPGSYDLSGTVIANAPGYTAGTGALTLTTVPIPSSASMLGAALLAFGTVSYRVKRRSKAHT